MINKFQTSVLSAKEAQCIKGGDGNPNPPYGPNNPIPNDKTRVDRPEPKEPIPYPSQPIGGNDIIAKL